MRRLFDELGEPNTGLASWILSPILLGRYAEGDESGTLRA
jgi:hypothetical protein